MGKKRGNRYRYRDMPPRPRRYFPMKISRVLPEISTEPWMLLFSIMLPAGKHVSLYAYTGGRNGFFSIYNFVPFVLRGHKAFINFADRGWARSCSPLHTRHHPLINKFILILEVFVHERNFFFFFLFLRINLLRQVSREKWIFNQCPLAQR